MTVVADAGTDWRPAGSCSASGDEMFPVQAIEQHRVAQEVCQAGCPVIRECLAYALDTGQEFGVWGGQTERERRALLKKRPDITSWSDVLLERTA